MVRRRSVPRRQGVRPLPAERRIEVGPDGYECEVRPVAGTRATKTYRCPGCDHELKPGIGHVLVWPADAGESAVEDRRHWHTQCWANRATRGPTRRWS